MHNVLLAFLGNLVGETTQAFTCTVVMFEKQRTRLTLLAFRKYA